MRDGEKKQSSRKVVRLFQKRWVFPTLYIACAAIILTAALWYQASKDPKQLSQKPSAPYSQQDNPTISVASPSEIVKMPVADADQVVVKTKFYDDKAEAKEQEEALVFYNNTYSANTGIDLAAKDGSAFDVTAAVSGTVTKAEKDALLGYVVTVESGNGITTFYQSLSKLQVEQGDTVSQGDVLGTAGMNELNKEVGNHVHFEIRKDNVAVNPESYFEKSVADIKVEQVSTEVKGNSKQPAEEKQPAKDEKQQTDKEEPAKDEKKQTEEDSTSSDTNKKQTTEEDTSSQSGTSSEVGESETP